MTTAFSSIVAAVIAQLSAAPAVCDTIYRARSNAIPETLDRAISVQFDQALPNRGVMNGAPIDWSTRITVECFARSATESTDIVVDPLLEAVFARLAADATLGGVVADLAIAGVEAENISEGKKTGWVRITYIAEHRTSNSTLEQE